MALEKCNAEIVKALGRELSNKEKLIVGRKAAALKDKIERAGNDPAAVTGILQQYGEEAEFEAARARRTAALNYLQTEKAKGWADRALNTVKNGSQVLTALVRQSKFNFEGAKDSLANRAQHEMNNRANGLLADLWKAGVQDYAFARENNGAIGGALYDMRNGGSEADAAAKYGKMAATTARLLEEHREKLRLDLNRVGAWIGKNSDAIFRRTHDVNKIATAGNNVFGSEEAKAAWVDSVARKMDWRKAFDGEYAGSTDKERKGVLADLWSDMASGVHLDGEAGGYGVGRGNKGKRWSHARQLAFKSAQDEVDYLNEFGKGNSIAEMIHDELRAGGKDYALMEKLGPNAEMNFEGIYRHLDKRLEQKGDVKGRAELRKTFDALKDNDWRILNGMAGHPADNFVGRYLTAGRLWTSAAALQNSIWSLTGDTAIRASMIAQRSGGSVAAKQFGAYINQAFGHGLSKEQAIKLASEMGVRFDGITHPLDPYMSDDIPRGMASKFMQFVTRFGGHNGWVNRLRVNNLVADAHHYWQLKDTKFAALPEGEQAFLRQFGITDKEWEIVRKSEARDLGNGIAALTPDKIAAADLKRFDSLIDSARPTDAMRTRARTDLAAKYRNLLGEQAERATVSPSLALQATMGLGRAGVQRGSLAGEAYRGALQLKGFLVNYMENHLGRELYGRHSEYRTFAQAMGDMVTLRNPAGRSAAKGMSKLMVAGYLNFLAVNYIKDIAMGKKPLDPFDWDAKKYGSVWDSPGFTASMRAFTKQSLGLYGEILADQQNKPFEGWGERISEKLLSPELEAAGNILDPLTRLGIAMGKKGGASGKDLDNASLRLFGTLYRQAPGTELYWTKGVLDTYLYAHMAEAMNPGYQKRLRERMKKEGSGLLLQNP